MKTMNAKTAVRLAVAAVALVPPARSLGVAYDMGSTTTPLNITTKENWVGDSTPGGTGEGVLDNSAVALPGTLYFGGGMTLGALTINSPTLNELLAAADAGADLNDALGGASGPDGLLPVISLGADAPDAFAIKETAGRRLNLQFGVSTPVIDVAKSTQDLTIQASLINKGGVTASLEKTGEGTLTILKPALGAITYGGSGQSVTITAGTLSVNDNTGLGHASNKVVLNGGTFQYVAAAAGSVSINRPFVVQAPSGIDVAMAAAGNTLAITGVVSGSSTLTKTGSSELILSNANGTFNGTVAVNQGSFRLQLPGSVQGATVQLNGNASVLNLRNDGGGNYNVNVEATQSPTTPVQLYVDHQSAAAGGLFTVGNVKLGSTLVLSGSATTANNEIAVNNVTLVGDGELRTNNIDSTVNGAIGESGGSFRFVKSGAKTLTLTQDSTHTGGTQVAGGTLVVAGDAMLGTADGTGTLGALTLSGGGTLKVTGPAFVTSRGIVPTGTGGTLDNVNDITTAGAVTGSGTLIKTNTGKLTTSAIRVGGLTLNGGTAVTVSPDGGPNSIGTLTASGGVVDLTNNTLVLTTTDSATLRGYLASGRNGGTAWDGTLGVTSSTAAGTLDKAVGYAAGDQLADTSLWGTTIAGADVVSRLTLYGDLNLNGEIDRDDYAMLDAGRGQYLAGTIAAGNAAWVNGDVNYDGIVDDLDYGLTDRAMAMNGGLMMSADFLAQREAQFGSDYVSSLVAAVPEPSLAGVLLVAGGLFGRRRRK